MKETRKQKRVRQGRDRAARKKDLAAMKKKLKDDRELTLHEAHRHSILCRRQHEGCKLRGFHRFVKDVDDVKYEPYDEVESNPAVEGRTWRYPHVPFKPSKVDGVSDDDIIDLVGAESVFDRRDALDLNIGYRVFVG